MPRNGSGVYSLPAGSIVANGETIDASQHNPPLQDIASDLNTARPISAGGTGAATAAAALVNLGLTATAAELNALDGVTSAGTALIVAADAAAQRTALGLATLSGRNLIINGSGRVNQRGYVSGTATSGANEFTLDRWFVVVSGQSLTFTGGDYGRVMTAPAGGVGQVIAGENIRGGTYVMNWIGTATATVNATARAKGEVFTLTAGANATVKFFSGTFTDVQSEYGGVSTPFEYLDDGEELDRCKRYFSVLRQPISINAMTSALGSIDYSVNIVWPVELASTPSISYTYVDEGNMPNSGSTGVTATTTNARFKSGSYASGTTGTGAGCRFENVIADAEITA